MARNRLGIKRRRPKYVRLPDSFDKKIQDVLNRVLNIRSASFHIEVFYRTKSNPYSKLSLSSENKNFPKGLIKILNSSPMSIENEGTHKDEVYGVNIFTLSPKLEVARASGIRSESSLPQFLHANIAIKTTDGSNPDYLFSIDTVRRYVSAILNEAYSTHILESISSVASTEEMAGFHTDPYFALEDFFIKANESIPDIEIAFWNFEPEIDALEFKASSFGEYLTDFFEEQSPIWDAFVSNKTLIINQLKYDIRKGGLGENGNFLVSVAQKRKWHSLVMMPVSVSNKVRGLLGIFCSYNADIYQIYKPIILFLRLQTVRAIIEAEKSERDVEARRKLKSLVPILAIGREHAQRMHDIKDRFEVINQALAVIKNPRNTDLHKLRKNASSASQALDEVKTVLSKQLQAFSRAREKLRKTNFIEYLKKLEEDFRFNAEFDQVTFEIYYPKDTSKIEVKIQPFYFERVLENLISNAIDFSKGHPYRVDPWVKVLIDLSDDKESLEIRVIDSGNGIAQSPPEIVFDEGETTKANGFGIGLSIVKEVVQEHGGKIEVEKDSPHRGASFLIQIPVINQA